MSDRIHKSGCRTYKVVFIMTVTPSAINKNLRKSNIEFEFFHFNKLVLSKNSKIEKYLHFKSLECKEYRKGLENLLDGDQGGFEHGGLSGLYNTFQNLPRYNSTRLCGWNNLLSNAFDHISSRSSLKDALIVDFLAGSGTLAKRVRQLLSGETPNIIGIDVSKKMVECALDSNEAVFWASHEVHPFKNEMADITIAAYGFHHVPLTQRRSFVSAMHRPLKKGGLCIIHDFEEGSATARWYSEIIHLNRPEGHPYPHVTKGELRDLLTPNFQNTTTKYLYDPFYLEGKEAKMLDKLVEQGLEEYQKGKCKTIKSLADLG